MPLALGLFSMTTGPCSHPEGAARVARAAEAAGFDSLWGGEHVVLPDPQAPPSPLAPEDRITDPIVALAFLAAHTTRIRLGTGSCPSATRWSWPSSSRRWTSSPAAA